MPNFDPAQLEQLRETRLNALCLKWSGGGRLTQTEFEEVRHLLPAGTSFDGEPTTNLSGRARYQHRLEHYREIYHASLRTLKRWVATGRATDPPELPPLDEPSAMLAWWTKHRPRYRAPARILQLAKIPSSQLGAGFDSAIDVSALGSEIVDAVRQAHEFLMAAKQHLAEAYKAGNESRIEICQRRWLKALRALKEAEQAAREDKKAAGDLIPKAELLPALSELIEILRHMRSTMRRRIAARLGELLAKVEEMFPGFTDKLQEAIEIERGTEDAVLRRLKQFRSTEEIDAFKLDDDQS